VKSPRQGGRQVEGANRKSRRAGHDRRKAQEGIACARASERESGREVACMSKRETGEERNGRAQRTKTDFFDVYIHVYI